MGQYYHPIVLNADGKIIIWMDAHQYGNGLKLTEHSYIGNMFVSAFEFALSPKGEYHKTRVVWAGDYADPEPGQEENLHQRCNEYNLIYPGIKNTTEYRFVVNHSKKQFVDKSKIPTRDGLTLHPLPLLTCEGNGRGGGDYRDDCPIVGSWARDIISVEKEVPDDFEEIIFDLLA
jgi:hypothetical protein